MKKLIAMLSLCVSASMLADGDSEYVGSNKLIIARKNLEQQKEQQKQNARDQAIYDKLHAIALKARPNTAEEPTEQDYKFADEFATKNLHTDFLQEEQAKKDAARKATRDLLAKNHEENGSARSKARWKKVLNAATTARPKTAVHPKTALGQRPR